MLCLPDEDDGEIEQIPRAPQVGGRMLPESVSDNFHHTFQSKDNEKNVFHFFLQERNEKGLTQSVGSTFTCCQKRPAIDYTFVLRGKSPFVQTK